MEENSEFIVFTTENTVVKLEHDEDDENNSGWFFYGHI